MKIFSIELIKLMHRKKLTKKQVADTFDASLPTVGRWLSGASKPVKPDWVLEELEKLNDTSN
jgi:DNA-binding transcriptional regulator YiaG